MVASIGVIASPAQGASYYEREGYYAKDDPAHREVAGAVCAVRSSVRAGWATKSAFEFLVLTAVRSGEVRGADWSEVDLEARTWTIPRGRMKGVREYRLPLSDRAMEILREAHGHTGGLGIVFPAARGRPIPRFFACRPPTHLFNLAGRPPAAAFALAALQGVRNAACTTLPPTFKRYL